MIYDRSMEKVIADKPARAIARRRGNRRQEILDIATECFLTLGFVGTTMSKIFERAGGSRATLYSHFASKEDIFEEVLRVALQNHNTDFSEVLQKPGDLRERLTEFCEHFITVVASAEGLALKYLIIDAARHYKRVGELFYTDGALATSRLLAAFMAEHYRQGHIFCRDPKEAAEVITSMCTGGIAANALWSDEPPNPEQIAQEAKRIADIVIDIYSVGNRPTLSSG